MEDFNYTVEQQIAVIDTRGKYRLELNIVSFNGYPAKYDLRRWGTKGDGETYPAKGIQLDERELRELKAQLDAMEL